MAARTPQNVQATHYGTDWLKIEWDDNTALSGDAPTGFRVWYDDTSVAVPTWTVPPAVDNELNGGDGASPVQHYTVMVNTATDVACWWETFEEYNGTYSMNGGGESWGGAWECGSHSAWNSRDGDDFESYAEGAQVTGEMDRGYGFSQPWEFI